MSRKSLLIGGAAALVAIALVLFARGGGDEHKQPQQPAGEDPGLVDPGSGSGEDLPDLGVSGGPPAGEGEPLPYTGGSDHAVDPEHDELQPGARTVIEGRRAQPVSPDPIDNDPGERAAAQSELSERPALQHLPFRSGGVRADIEDVVGERVVVVVRHSAGKGKAQRAWKQFLRRHRDSGKGYIVLFRKG